MYDLISSSSSLQWMQPLDALFCRLASMLKPGGRLLCSLMVEGTLGRAAPPAPGDRSAEKSARPTADGRRDGRRSAKRRVPGLPFRTGHPANETQQHRRPAADDQRAGIHGRTAGHVLGVTHSRRVDNGWPKDTPTSAPCPGARSGRTTSSTTSRRSKKRRWPRSKLRSSLTHVCHAERSRVRLPVPPPLDKVKVSKVLTRQLRDRTLVCVALRRPSGRRPRLEISLSRRVFHVEYRGSNSGRLVERSDAGSG